jgi:gliding motility-associatede transport system auxiliary component
LTKIQEMEAEAVKASQSEINGMQEKVNEAQRKINELQQAKKDKDQRFVLSPEQQQELVNLRKSEADTNKRLKELKKETRKKIVARESFHKWMDILAIPLAVTLSGIGIAVVKGRKTSAK